MKLRSALCFALLTTTAFSQGNHSVADQLDWIQDPNIPLCRGYFYEPQWLSGQVPGPIEHSPTEISYSGPSVLSAHGQSTITKEIILKQPGRQAKADKAIIQRDPETDDIHSIHLEGHVTVREPGKFVAGPYCTIDLDNETLETGPATYHLHRDYEAWGRADKTFKETNGLFKLWNATYTTCAPSSRPDWELSAKRLVLDQAEGFGTAYHMTLRFLNVPFLYVPIYSFPIDNRRKTGFLNPDFSYSTDNGMQFSQPYYWNLAPNYDLTTTPSYITERGFHLNSLFRYLSGPFNYSEFFFGLAPYDNQFRQFREDTLNNPPPAPPTISLTPYLDDLSNDKATRGFLHLKNHFYFNENWSGHLQANYVTDDYYFKDFGQDYSDIIANQLLNQADIEYQSTHWQFTGLIQAYQTLHRIDQATFPAVNQYTRLPELDFNGHYADLFGGTDFSLDGQSVNFIYQSDFDPISTELPIGERLHLRPLLSRTFSNAYAYVTPQVALDSTFYATQSVITDDMDSRSSLNASRYIPIVDIDSGLYFDQPLQIAHHHYLATLEPRLFYLLVPLLNQSKYPNFDSTLLPFTFAQLFDVNRFTSFDRLENANQISIGVTSRFLEGDSAYQKFKVDLGFGYYLQSPQVCLDPNDCQGSTYQYISPSAKTTPLIGQLSYYPWQNWSTTLSYAWDTKLGETNNAELNVQYNRDQRYVFNTTYQFVREQNGDPEDVFGFSNDTHLMSSGLALPLSEHWSELAAVSYNISKKRPDSYYGGFQYDSCCWTFRVIASRSFSSQETNSAGDPVNLFKNAYFVQLQLKSLGNIGSSPGSLLTNTLGGFLDPFK